MSDIKNLVAAKLQVMRAVRYVQKQGRMQGVGSYTYAKEGDFIAELRPAMIDAGLTIAPVKTELVHTEQYQTAKGGSMNRLLVRRVFRLSHLSGEFEDIETLGESADSGDKCANKAMTAAKKYALREAFLVETGDDPDDTPSEQYQRSAAPKVDTDAILQRHIKAMRAATDVADLQKAWGDFYAEAQSGTFSDVQYRVGVDVKDEMKVKLFKK